MKFWMLALMGLLNHTGATLFTGHRNGADSATMRNNPQSMCAAPQNTPMSRFYNCASSMWFTAHHQCGSLRIINVVFPMCANHDAYIICAFGPLLASRQMQYVISCM